MAGGSASADCVAKLQNGSDFSAKRATKRLAHGRHYERFPVSSDKTAEGKLFIRLRAATKANSPSGEAESLAVGSSVALGSRMLFDGYVGRSFP